MLNFVPLRYSLPKTVLNVRTHVRYVVVVDDKGGHLAPQVSLAFDPQVVADPAGPCSVTIDAAVMESVSLTVELSPNGLIESIGTAGGGNGSSSGANARRNGPMMSSVKDLPLQEGSSRLNVDDPSSWTSVGALRQIFGRTHPRTAALIADLSARAEQFLAGLRMSDQATEVLAFGSALEVVERELAAADRMRREWSAIQGFDVRSGSWSMDLSSAISLPGATADELPINLPGDTVVPAVLADLARDYGVLIALVDPNRSESTAVTGGLDRRDELLLRRARQVTVAVYRRVPQDSLGFEADAPWELDPALTTRLDAVDAWSLVDVLSPDSKVFGERAVHLAFHPDGAVRSFGVTSGQQAANHAGTFIGSARSDDQGSGTDHAPGLSEVTAAALEAARLQLELLHVADEFTKLAATHAHRGELATLEQDARFAVMGTIRRP